MGGSKMRTRNFRTRTRRRPVRQNARRGGFLLVTLAQCALCAAMVAMAYFASSLFGMTELKPVFSALLTQETDAKQVFSCVKALWEEAREIPDNVFSEKLILSAPMTQAVAGTLTSGYGFREDPFTGKMTFHTGVDLAAPAGSAVLAAYPGRVKEIGVSAAYGNYIILQHGNFSTRYCHCLSVIPREGEFVFAGEEIARVGSTGNSTGPHLHLELLVDGKNADPMPEMKGWTCL